MTSTDVWLDLPVPAPTGIHPSNPPPGRGWVTAHGVFHVAVGPLALHVVDDNFFQPAASTSATDPRWCRSRWRSGLTRESAPAAPQPSRSSWACSGSCSASEAAYYTGSVGPSGDDYTGLVSIPAGVVLIGLSGVRLWRSRRQTPNHAWRYLRRGLIGAVALVVAYQTVFPIGFAFVTTHVARAEVATADLGSGYEDVTLETSDGLQLEGWYVPSRNGAAVVVFPGRERSPDHARMLARHGHGVLLFDRRGEGASEGAGNMYGWGGERDIVAALDYLQARADVEPGRIVGLGLSVGGELMLQTAAEDDRLAAVVSKGAGTRTFNEEVKDLPMGYLWPMLPAMALKTAAVALFSNTMPPAQLTDLVPEIAPRAALFIWAPDGGNIETMNPRFHRLAGPNAEIWAIDDTRHVAGITTHRDEYEVRVVGFFDEALLAGR